VNVFDDATNELVADVAALAAQPGTGEVSEQPRHTLEMVALFDRCRGLYGAVRLLAQRGFGQEALILARPMFTESLMLLEVASGIRSDRSVTGAQLARTRSITATVTARVRRRRGRGRGQPGSRAGVRPWTPRRFGDLLLGGAELLLRLVSLRMGVRRCP
jgi:hypothetical protein